MLQLNSVFPSVTAAGLLCCYVCVYYLAWYRMLWFCSVPNASASLCMYACLFTRVKILLKHELHRQSV